MSDDLVEKVARAIRQAHFASHPQNNFGYPHAAAAIAAVAEWLESRSQFDGDGKGVVAAALRAAAGGGE